MREWATNFEYKICTFENLQVPKGVCFKTRHCDNVSFTELFDKISKCIRQQLVISHTHTVLAIELMIVLRQKTVNQHFPERICVPGCNKHQYLNRISCMVFNSSFLMHTRAPDQHTHITLSVSLSSCQQEHKIVKFNIKNHDQWDVRRNSSEFLKNRLRVESYTTLLYVTLQLAVKVTA